MQKTNISWTDYTSNPIKFRDTEGKSVWGCVKVSPGCTNCYAEALALRYGRGGPFDTKTMAALTPFVDEKEIRAILRSKAPAGSLVFVGDMTDIFGEWVPDAMLDQVFATMALRPDLHFQVLTKRVKRMREYAETIMASQRLGNNLGLPSWPLPNVSLGITVCNQQEADRDSPELCATSAAIRYISYEPALGPVDWKRFIPVAGADGYCLRCWLSTFDLEPGDHECPPGFGPALDMIIVGGESGPKARPFDIAWPRVLVAQCRAAGVAVHVKQLGRRPYEGQHVVPRASGDDRKYLRLRSSHGSDPTEWPEDLCVRDPWPGVTR